MGKGENAGHQHFLLFQKCFLVIPKQISVFQSHFLLSFANAFKLEQSRNLDISKLKTLADIYIKDYSKDIICPLNAIKLPGNRRKCWSPAFSSFPRMFIRAVFVWSLECGIAW